MLNGQTLEQARSDSELVAETLAGNREAFGEIVARYQSLVCSLAYSATGSLSQSEDVAQETFLRGWKQLRSLREPERLRSWLCGITRHLVADELRRRARDASGRTVMAESEADSAGVAPPPSAEVVKREEEGILWGSLERVPEPYREPLVLFYRENQSVAAVAAALELTEDAVKQRLSRGRKLLNEQVAAFVEGALARTRPGKAFTVGVLAALPVFTASASAAVIGATASESAAAAKISAISGLSGAIAGPLIGIAGGWLGYKASMANATSVKERKLITRFLWLLIGLIVCSLAGLMLIISTLQHGAPMSPFRSASLLLICGVVYILLLFGLIFRFNQLQSRIRSEAEASGEAIKPRGPWVTTAHYEYRSKARFMGLPLVHVRAGGQAGENWRPAVGWIAIGDQAVGLLVAAGGLSIGTISLGGVSFGALSIGGAALGALCVGGLAVGGWALGGIAAGYMAVGGSAMGWHAALGGIAVAKHYAIGGLAEANHANDAAARAFLESSAFFDMATQAAAHASWVAWLCWGPIIIFVALWRLRGGRGRAS